MVPAVSAVSGQPAWRGRKGCDAGSWRRSASVGFAGNAARDEVADHTPRGEAMERGAGQKPAQFRVTVDVRIKVADVLWQCLKALPMQDVSYGSELYLAQGIADASAEV